METSLQDLLKYPRIKDAVRNRLGVVFKVGTLWVKEWKKVDGEVSGAEFEGDLDDVLRRIEMAAEGVGMQLAGRIDLATEGSVAFTPADSAHGHWRNPCLVSIIGKSAMWFLG